MGVKIGNREAFKEAEIKFTLKNKTIMPKLVNQNPIMRTQKSLVVRNNIQVIKKICEERGIDYEIYQTKKPKISSQEIKGAFQKLAKSKTYEKEMKEWDAIEDE